MSTGHPLTEEQILYIVHNFSDMRNQDLADELGISKSSVSTVQKRFCLRKSEEYSHSMAAKAGRASLDARGGKSLAITPEVVARRVETYRQTFRLEKARTTFGLPQRTKMKVKRQPKKKVDQRCYLKSLGYILDEPNCIAYWTEETRRATRMEARPRMYYRFMPLTRNTDTIDGGSM